MAEQPPAETGTDTRHRPAEEGVRILALRQEDTARGYTSRAEMMGEPLRSLLAAAIAVDIEGEIDGARAIA